MESPKPGCLKIPPVLCLLISLATTASEYSENSGTDDGVRIVSGPHYPPFSGDHLPQNGLGPFLVSRIFEASGKQVISGFRPWKRAYREALQGKYDAVLPYTETANRRQDFLFSEPVFKVNSSIFVRSDSSIRAQSLSELTGLKYCNPLGFADGRPIERMESAGHLTRISPSTLENCFKMLAAGRVDFIKTNPHVAQYMSGNHGLSPKAFRALTFIVDTESLHVMVPRNHPAGEALIETFNHSYTRMKEAGRIKELAKAYLESVKAAAEPLLTDLE
jgi:polar amino acid transport system substrate-binding protein